MDIIEQLEDEYPDITFQGMSNVAKGFDATLSSSELGLVLFYNTDVSPSEQYSNIKHELEHYKDGDVKYNERNEYRAEVNSSWELIDEKDLRNYVNANPYIEDIDVAEHFNLTLSQLYKCVNAYSIKGVTFTNTHLYDSSIFFRSS